MEHLLNSLDALNIFNMHSDPDSDPAGRPEFSHGVQMDSRRFPSSNSEIFLQGKTTVEVTGFLRGPRPRKELVLSTAVLR